MAKRSVAKKSARKPAARSAARTTRRSAGTARPRTAGPRAAAIQGWPTDPMGGLPPLQFNVPALPGSTLPTRIIAPAPAPPARVHAVGSDGFRYWTAAETLRRSAAFWSGVGVPGWHSDVGATIPVRLDDGVDLNAYYARNDFPSEDIKQGLSFFHDTVREVSTGRQVTVFSGESPDVVGHELGHAVLDRIKPVLWGLSSIEAAAFHESFGDMSAILTALQLPAVRQSVLEETTGRLQRNSSVSRVAEQLGFAIRQRNPAGVDRDSLRNAANAFLYVDPLTLPSSGPATSLTRAGHNFSRVFTGAFLEALGGMVARLSTTPAEEDVQDASVDMGRLLVRAVISAPVSTKFFQSVAEQMVLADGALFSGKYAEALTTAFVRRGLMSVRSLAAPGALAASPARAAVAAARFSAAAAGRSSGPGTTDTSVQVALDGTTLGLPVKTLYVDAPAVDDTAAPLASMMAGVTARDVAVPRMADVQAFVEALVVRGRVSLPATTDRRVGLTASLSQARKHATHYLKKRTDEALALERIAFECW